MLRPDGRLAVFGHAFQLPPDVAEAFASVSQRVVPDSPFKVQSMTEEALQTWPTGVPLATEAAAMIASYLAAERDLGRIVVDADIDTLALTLIGAGHLQFADRKGAAPEPGAVRKMVTTVLAGVVPEPQP